MNKYKHNYNVILDNMDINEYRLRPISAIMYLQDAFARFCATKKVAAYDLFPTNQYWIVSEFNIEFTDSLPFWSEEITTEIWISEITKLKIYTDFNLYYQDKVIAAGNGCWFILDQETKRPAKTDIISKTFNIHNELVLGEHKKFTLNTINEKVNEIVHKNNLSDLDFNNHVNNKSYVNIAEATASSEFKKTHTLKTLNIKFNRESFLGDVLICSTYKTDNENVYVHKITKDGESVCDIQTAWIDKTKDEQILNYDLKVKHET
jgi:medium-chain acyl-[acyl-carrier-protein] hydrolase